jgi:hypothetical protein
MEVVVNGSSSDGIFAATINADDGMVAVASTVDNDNPHCCRHHWPKTPSPLIPLCHCPSIPPPPLLTTTAIDKDHHCHGTINHRFHEQ